VSVDALQSECGTTPPARDQCRPIGERSQLATLRIEGVGFNSLPMDDGLGRIGMDSTGDVGSTCFRDHWSGRVGTSTVEG
jgi:hypothetical protein